MLPLGIIFNNKNIYLLGIPTTWNQYLPLEIPATIGILYPPQGIWAFKDKKEYQEGYQLYLVISIGIKVLKDIYWTSRNIEEPVQYYIKDLSASWGFSAVGSMHTRVEWFFRRRKLDTHKFCKSPKFQNVGPLFQNF